MTAVRDGPVGRSRPTVSVLETVDYVSVVDSG